MIVHYFSIGWRSLSRQWKHSLINILGLAIGMACCILILLYVLDERSYDHFHRDSERIYRVGTVEKNNDGQQELKARTMRAIAYTLRQDLPEVEAAATIFQRRQLTMRYNEFLFLESRVIESDSNLFTVFTFPFIKGMPSEALTDPHAIVLTASTANRYFGNDEPIGKTIRAEDQEYTVTGIVSDVPSNAHFHFDMIVPLRTIEEEHNTNWQGSPNYFTYVKLREQSSPSVFPEKLAELKKKYNPESTNDYFIQPLTDIHLHSNLKGEMEPNGDAASLRIITFIAAFVIVIAAINYINLATARATRRAREVGVRKTNGALRSMLIGQFLAESVLTSLIAFLFAVVLAALLIYPFNALFGKSLALLRDGNGILWLMLTGVAMGIGLIAGIYPALLLSSFNPVKVLKGAAIHTTRSGNWLRKSLVAFQFTISIALIIAAITVKQQMNYVRQKDPGFSRDHVIVISQAGKLPNRSAIEQKMEQLAGVDVVGASTALVGQANWTGNIRADLSQTDRLIDFCQIDYEYLDALGIQLLQGRNFSPEFPADTVNTIILNETAVKALNLKNPVGQQLIWDAAILDTLIYAEVVGVVRDFHYASFHEPIRPFAFLIRNNFFVQEDFTSTLLVKTAGGHTNETIHQLESIWKQYVPQRPFTYVYMEDSYRDWHVAEERFELLFSCLTGLAIFIACLGLFALITFVVGQRTREISIRKVLGASITSILILINKDLALLVCFAFVAASVPGIYFINNWLDTFAYHVSLSAWIFAAAGLTALLIIIATTGYQSFKASRANPVDSLKAE